MEQFPQKYIAHILAWKPSCRPTERRSLCLPSTDFATSANLHPSSLIVYRAFSTSRDVRNGLQTFKIKIRCSWSSISTTYVSVSPSRTHRRRQCGPWVLFALQVLCTGNACVNLERDVMIAEYRHDRAYFRDLPWTLSNGRLSQEVPAMCTGGSSTTRRSASNGYEFILTMDLRKLNMCGFGNADLSL